MENHDFGQGNHSGLSDSKCYNDSFDFSNFFFFFFSKSLQFCFIILFIELDNCSSSNNNGMNCASICRNSRLFISFLLVVYFHLREEKILCSSRSVFTFLLLSSSFFLSERFHPLRVLPLAGKINRLDRGRRVARQ